MKIIKSVIENFFKFFGYQITLEKITKIHKIFKNKEFDIKAPMMSLYVDLVK